MPNKEIDNNRGHKEWFRFLFTHLSVRGRRSGSSSSLMRGKRTDRIAFDLDLLAA
ncbi:hypothetical protein BSM4216_3625 [Bacillus smithii]|nr:hypothetical protein BSM4216_3625 [Bacillus smithii]